MTKSNIPRDRRRLQIAMIGNAHDHDLLEAVEQLRSCCDLTIYADPAQAASLLSKANKRPSLFIIAQTRPGCFSHDAIARLQQRIDTGAAQLKIGDSELKGSCTKFRIPPEEFFG